MTNQKTVVQVRSSVHAMFESIHVVMDELLQRPDLIESIDVSLVIKQMEVAEAIFHKSFKAKEPNNV